VKVCVPVAEGGSVDPRWGRADRVAIADVSDGSILGWQEYEVGWGQQHDASTEGAHHARVAGFLRDNRIQVVVANHMGTPMAHMLEKMGIDVHLGAEGHAGDAVVRALGRSR
jgi:predicted Fe-Mo cluster-binding NifX family protein